MYRFFLPPNAIIDDIVTVTGNDAHHIGHSLRMKKGEEIVFTREGKDYFCEISGITGDEVTAKIIKSEAVKSEPKLKLTLFQALPKSDKLELIIQKCTELGIFKIIPFLSGRCVSRPKDTTAKTERFQKIAEAAAKQSGRGIIPKVSEIINFADMLQLLCSFEIVLFCNENGGERIKLPAGTKNAALVVGAEGGFSAAEAASLATAGAVSVTLGSRILRCETAPIAATAIVMYIAGEN
jgi:16S rRNA (uracil1498-N3)-methyltransferase